MRYLLFHSAERAKAPFSRRARAARMRRFLERIAPRPGDRVIDLGGVAAFWQDCPVPLEVTVLNLPGTLVPPPAASPHRFRMLEGDACATGLADGAFDIAFSNSVIEHVGPPERQRAFASEARRLAPRYWVQTPSVWFPLEAHTHMPFWWAYPEPLKGVFIRRWRRTLPAWCEMVEGTTVIARAELARMFPDARLWTERFAGIAKSYVAWRA